MKIKSCQVFPVLAFTILVTLSLSCAPDFLIRKPQTFSRQFLEDALRPISAHPYFLPCWTDDSEVEEPYLLILVASESEPFFPIECMALSSERKAALKKKAELIDVFSAESLVKHIDAIDIPGVRLIAIGSEEEWPSSGPQLVVSFSGIIVNPYSQQGRVGFFVEVSAIGENKIDFGTRCYWVGLTLADGSWSVAYVTDTGTRTPAI